MVNGPFWGMKNVYAGLISVTSYSKESLHMQLQLRISHREKSKVERLVVIYVTESY
jgi:hypothetical protein